jgi:putative membrane protein
LHAARKNRNACGNSKEPAMIATVLCLVVAALHAYFLYLEMFAWEAPRTRAAFGTTADFAKASKVLAANQGLYNGFLAAGIALSLWQQDRSMLLFMLACVIVAGLYGAATASRRILFIQALPAAVAALAVLAKL